MRIGTKKGGNEDHIVMDFEDNSLPVSGNFESLPTPNNISSQSLYRKTVLYSH